jgi:hypothetical protein
MTVTRARERSGFLGGFAGRILALAGMAAVLTLVLSNVPLQSATGATVSAAPAAVEQEFRTFLPLLIRPRQASIAIYDLGGVEQDWDWLTETFGAVTLDRGTGSASVHELRAIEGPATLVVRIEDADGNALEGVPVVFYWPDAPMLLPEQQACGLDRGLIIPTKSNGNAEFAMGGGSYYFPPGGGPHVVWVPTGGTDCLGGLGMLGGTNHTHLDSVWRMP